MPQPVHILALDTSGRVCDLALLSQVNGVERIRCLSFEGQTQHAERLLPLVSQLLAEAGIQRGQLSAVAFGQGPGGFTGLRVACGIAQGLAFALDIGVIAVGSLFAAALSGGGSERVRVVLQDARMNEVYAAAYVYRGKTPEHSSEAGCPDNPALWYELQPPVLLGADGAASWVQAYAPAWCSAAGLGASKQPSHIRVVGDALEAYPQHFSGLFANSAQANTVQPMLPAGAVRLIKGPVVRPEARFIAKVALARYLAGHVSLPHEVSPLYVRDKVAFTIAEREKGFGGNPAAPLPVIITPMVPADIAEVSGIESTVQAFPWTSGNFADALQTAYPTWVARQAGRILGFYVAHYIDDTAHLLLIAVAPSAQRQGVGHQLLQHLQAQARQRQVAKLTLEVRVSNQSAIHFYQNRGFTEAGRRKGYYRTHTSEREDALVMDKRLQDVNTGSQ